MKQKHQKLTKVAELKVSREVLQREAEREQKIAETQNRVANMTVAELLLDLGYAPDEVTPYIYIDTDGDLSGMEIRHPFDPFPEDEAVFLEYVGAYQHGPAGVRDEMIEKRNKVQP